MSSTVKIYEKPLLGVEVVDWVRNLQELQRNSFGGVQTSFDTRYEVRELSERFSTNARWETYRNTKLLLDKVEDITFWLEEFKFKLQQFTPAIKKLKDEKTAVDKEITKMDELFRVDCECNSIRDQRMVTELVNDVVKEELKKEIILADKNKKLLQKVSHCAWELLNYLDNLKFRLNQELEQKTETMVIDTDQANLDLTSDKLSFKIDALKIAKHSESKEIWIKRQQAILDEATAQLAKSIEARETLFMLRGKATDLMDAQRMATEYVLRRRLHENTNAIKELEWHKARLEIAMSKFSDEIIKIDKQVQEFIRKLKLAETRLINKTYRAIGEKGLDLANEAIRLEARNLNDMINNLSKKSEANKSSYNQLERQYRSVCDDLQYKYQSLELDKKVFDMKEAMKTASDKSKSSDKVNSTTKIPDECKETNVNKSETVEENNEEKNEKEPCSCPC